MRIHFACLEIQLLTIAIIPVSVLSESLNDVLILAVWIFSCVSASAVCPHVSSSSSFPPLSFDIWRFTDDVERLGDDLNSFLLCWENTPCFT